MTCQEFIARDGIENFDVFQKLCQKVVKLVKDKEIEKVLARKFQK